MIIFALVTNNWKLYTQTTIVPWEQIPMSMKKRIIDWNDTIGVTALK